MTDAGYEVVGRVRTVDEAVAVAALKKPELLIVDVNLCAGGNGIDAATRIHADLGICRPAFKQRALAFAFKAVVSVASRTTPEVSADMNANIEL